MKTKIIKDEILEVLSLENMYNVINNNFLLILKDEDMEYFQEVQQFCLDIENKIGGIEGHYKDNLYEWFPKFGKVGYINRSYDYPDRDIGRTGMMAEILRCWAVDSFDPQFNLALGASALAINPILHHHNDRQGPLKDVSDLLAGKKIGCICITEPNRGSDAVNMETICEDDGDDVIINGIKVYNTNSPKADIAVVYAVYDPNDPRGTMIQAVSHKEWDKGFKAERIGVPSVPRVHIGKTIFEDARIPAEYILAEKGKGRDHLFEGLVPERIGIAALNIGQAWGAFATALLYANLRKQFEREILIHQAVGMTVLGKYHSELVNASMALIKMAEVYDEKKESGMLDNPMFQQYFVALASQFKYTTSKLYHELTYELMHAMGGAGVIDNTRMPTFQGVSEIAEVVGGTRNVQLMIASRALRTLFKMSV
ncbi:MAG: acyl-CoA dehydrogenase family protein [Candidatus Hodarchaeota archaeon]